MSDAYEEHTRLMARWWSLTLHGFPESPDLDEVEAQLEVTWRAMTPEDHAKAKRLAEAMNAAEDATPSPPA